jgi:hypothetical protein
MNLIGGFYRCVCVFYVKFTGFTTVQTTYRTNIKITYNSAYLAARECNMTVWNTVLLSVLWFLALYMYHLKLINLRFSLYGRKQLWSSYLWWPSLMGSQIFQTFRSYIQILGARRRREGIFHTEDQHFWSGLQASFFLDFLLGECKLIHKFVREERNCSNYVENIRSHSAKFSHPNLWNFALVGCVILQFTTRIKRQVAKHVRV